MIVLGIETSCDETAAALVTEGRRILVQELLSQDSGVAEFGGVVPEMAARAHLEHLDRLVAAAMARAGVGWGELSAVAVTAGPGLIGGVFVGVVTGKAIALAARVPFLAVNHLEGHALTARLTDDVPFPYLLLLASGGHCQWLAVEGVGRYRLYGQTLDDAAGECFDKVAKLLGLPQPGGPAIARAADSASNPGRFPLPRPLLGRPGYDVSFSGLKTAVRAAVEGLGRPPTGADIADLSAATQAAIVDVLADRTRRAAARFRAEHPDGGALVAAGGVAANRALRARLAEVAAAAGLPLVVPPPALCTDNAAMIAWAGLERLRLGRVDTLAAPARPRWPLEELRRVG